MLRRLLRKPLTWVVVALLAVGATFGMYWFQPWKLLTDQTVNEAAPPVGAPPTSAGGAAPATPAPPGSSLPAVTAPPPRTDRVLAAGAFVTQEHATSGTVRITHLADGRRVLTLENLATDNGPDLRVWLTDQPVKADRSGWQVFDDGRYVELGRLKGNRGTQNYELPGELNLAEYRSVSIWCKRFSVSFGAAELAAG